jgi:hypothetical protein
MHIDRPALPNALAPSKDTTYSATDFKTDYSAYTAAAAGAGAGANPDAARALRDKMINRIEVDIEQDYREFEGKLFATRATMQTGSDIVELGLSATIGVVEGSDVKDLLAASLTGFKGSRLSFDKNFFREKTTEALISQMQAYRDTVRNRITQKVADLDAKKYPFEEAWRDLVEYFYAGSIPAALQQLANTSGKAAIEAKDESKAIDIQRANTEEQKTSAIRIRQKYDALSKAINGTDQAAKDQALKTAKETLTALGQSDKLTPTTTSDEVLTLLRAQMRHALDHPEEISSLDKLLSGPTQ